MKPASARVPVNKGAKLPGEVLEASEVVALIRACGRGPAGVRNAALIAIMFGAGLRVSEALALKPSDLNLKNGTVRVRHGKGDRARTVALDPSAQAYVERWLGRREQLGLNGRQPLFCTISKGEGSAGTIDSSYVRGRSRVSLSAPAWSAESTRTRSGTRSRQRSRTRGSRCRRSPPSSATPQQR